MQKTSTAVTLGKPHPRPDWSNDESRFEYHCHSAVEWVDSNRCYRRRRWHYRTEMIQCSSNMNRTSASRSTNLMKVVFEIGENRFSILVIVSFIQLFDQLTENFLIGLYFNIDRCEIFLQFFVGTKLSTDFFVMALNGNNGLTTCGRKCTLAYLVYLHVIFTQIELSKSLFKILPTDLFRHCF